MEAFSVTYDEEQTELHFVIQKPQTSDDVLQYFHISRKQRYEFYQNRQLRKNGVILHRSVPLSLWDTLSLTLFLQEDVIPAWDHELVIRYEDALCLVVEKPVGMLVHSDGVNTTHTLDHCVKAYYDSQQIHTLVRPIHRLDQETSGLVFYCKLPFFQPYLDDLLRQKRIERIYLAWVKGILTKTVLTIDAPIGRDRHNAKKMRVSVTGAAAKTMVYPKQQIHNATLVECHLKTGRTHQIRVHLAHIQYPILSDPLYGTKDTRINRCALHAWKLRFEHPLLKETIEVISPLPQDMQAMLPSSSNKI